MGRAIARPGPSLPRSARNAGILLRVDRVQGEALGEAMRATCLSLPEPDLASWFDNVFAEQTEELRAQQAEYIAWRPVWRCGMTTMSLAKAINAGLHAAMAADENVLAMGEDIGQLGGVFRVTDGLQEAFGEHRVMDSPLAESGILGTSIGLAHAGFRSVVEIQFDGFTVYPAYDQIVTQLSRQFSRTDEDTFDSPSSSAFRTAAATARWSITPKAPRASSSSRRDSRWCRRRRRKTATG